MQRYDIFFTYQKKCFPRCYKIRILRLLAPTSSSVKGSCQGVKPRPIPHSPQPLTAPCQTVVSTLPHL